jgi:hypothetical protein
MRLDPIAAWRIMAPDIFGQFNSIVKLTPGLCAESMASQFSLRQKSFGLS